MSSVRYPVFGTILLRDLSPMGKVLLVARRAGDQLASPASTARWSQAGPTRPRRSTYKGERKRVQARLPAHLAERLERDAIADRRSVSEYLALLLERAYAQEAARAS